MYLNSCKKRERLQLSNKEIGNSVGNRQGDFELILRGVEILRIKTIGKKTAFDEHRGPGMGFTNTQLLWPNGTAVNARTFQGGFDISGRFLTAARSGSADKNSGAVRCSPVERVGVDGYKQVGMVALGNSGPLIQFDKPIILPGHNDIGAAFSE